MSYSEQYQKESKEAKELLLHYFDLAGVNTNSDCSREIESIVNHIVDAAIAKLKEELFEKMLKDQSN